MLLEELSHGFVLSPYVPSRWVKFSLFGLHGIGNGSEIHQVVMQPFTSFWQPNANFLAPLFPLPKTGLAPLSSS